MTGWTTNDIPDLRGRRALVTGGSTGLGRDVARVLAAKGASVLLTSRSAARAETVAAALKAELPQADIAGAALDLADLTQLRGFVARRVAEPPLDLLINNAGLLPLAQRGLTADGFELTFGANFLGPFALTGLLLPALANQARIITVASLAHRRGRLDFTDLQGETRYSIGTAYSQSKLADLMFALELDRRLRRHATPVVSLAAHPGLAYTDLGIPMLRDRPAIIRVLADTALRVLGQSSAQGALPILQAATDQTVPGGSYTGPNRLSEFRGQPAPAKIFPHAQDTAAAARLWATAEALTGVTYLND